MLIIVLLLYEKVTSFFPVSAKQLSRTPLSVLDLNSQVLQVGLLDRWIKFSSVNIQMKAAVVISGGTVNYAKQLGVTNV